MTSRWTAVFSCAALVAPALSNELRAQDADAAARQVIEDVCLAVGCRVQVLRGVTTPPVPRLTELRRAACGGDLDAVFAALGAPADPGIVPAVDRAEALRTACQLASGPVPAASPAPPGGGALGIPKNPVPHPHPYLLERSILFPFQQHLILEAQIAPHLYFWENLTSQRMRLLGGNAFAVSVTPMFKVRIRNEASSPVQTLSFMPKLNLQYFHLGRKEATKLWPDTFWMKGGLFVWGHHSNGQTQCIYDASLPDDDPRCKGPADPAAVHIAYPTGSFSTNYLKLALFLTRIHAPSDNLAPSPEGEKLVQQVPDTKTTFAAIVEVNPPSLPPGGSLSEPARSLYGPNRFGLLAEHERRTRARSGFVAGSYRLTGLVEYIDKVPDAGSSRWRFTSEAAFEPDWFRAGGFVARYIYGQDYYNLQFDRNISWFQFGLIFSASEFEPFLSKRN